MEQIKVGDIVIIEDKKYMACDGECGDCDCYNEDLPCPEGCGQDGKFLSRFNRLCDNWDEEKSECRVYSYGGTFVDTNGYFYTIKIPRHYCEGCYCPNYQVLRIEEN